MERDLHVRKETYICGERPVKETLKKTTSGADLYASKETYGRDF